MLRLFGQEQYLCDFREYGSGRLIDLVYRLWKNREQIGRTILSNIPAAEKGIFAGAKRVYALLKAKTSSQPRAS